MDWPTAMVISVAIIVVGSLIATWREKRTGKDGEEKDPSM